MGSPVPGMARRTCRGDVIVAVDGTDVARKIRRQSRPRVFADRGSQVKVRVREGEALRDGHGDPRRNRNQPCGRFHGSSRESPLRSTAQSPERARVWEAAKVGECQGLISICVRIAADWSRKPCRSPALPARVVVYASRPRRKEQIFRAPKANRRLRNIPSWCWSTAIRLRPRKSFPPCRTDRALIMGETAFKGPLQAPALRRRPAAHHRALLHPADASSTRLLERFVLRLLLPRASHLQNSDTSNRPIPDARCSAAAHPDESTTRKNHAVERRVSARRFLSLRQHFSGRPRRFPPTGPDADLMARSTSCTPRTSPSPTRIRSRQEVDHRHRSRFYLRAFDKKTNDRAVLMDDPEVKSGTSCPRRAMHAGAQK